MSNNSSSSNKKVKEKVKDNGCNSSSSRWVMRRNRN